jgi:predicted RNA-binding Zn-ribbon protein involved in translation (DUF1610 family)
VGFFSILKGDAPAPAPAKGPAPAPAPADAGEAGEGHAQGCVVCGEALVYGTTSERLLCVICGAEKDTTARCAGGHYVCDACHAAPAKDVIERTCLASDEKDPVALAMRLLRHPALKLHGPEHHFLVPAVLVTALSNVKGEKARKAERLAEARRRSDPIAGGFCGTLGTCGAAVGTGTFVSIATQATPLKGKERGLANRMTARALTVIGQTDAARCCKRDSLLSILAAARFAKEHLRVDIPAHGAACEWSEKNAECGGAACPFNR